MLPKERAPLTAGIGRNSVEVAGVVAKAEALGTTTGLFFGACSLGAGNDCC